MCPVCSVHRIDPRGPPINTTDAMSLSTPRVFFNGGGFGHSPYEIGHFLLAEVCNIEQLMNPALKEGKLLINPPISINTL